MRRDGRATICLVLFAMLASVPQCLWGQRAAPPSVEADPSASEFLELRATRADTWMEGSANVVQLEGPVHISMDHTTLEADEAVVWLSTVRGAVLDRQHVQIALIGHSMLEQPDIKRSGPSLLVSGTVRGTIRIIANQRLAQDRSNSALYQAALALRRESTPVTMPGNVTESTSGETPRRNGTAAAASATTRPAGNRRSGAGQPVHFELGAGQTTQLPDGTIAIIITGGVTLYQAGPDGDLLSLQARNVVLFTNLRHLQDALDKNRREHAITAAYLEGDVRIVFTPPGRRLAESRLEASRAYYEFATDRAILTDVVLHTMEPRKQIPVIVRASAMRQLALNEYGANDTVLTTSAFATPSYALAVGKAYVRQVDTDDPELGERAEFSAQNVTFDLYGLPVFWLPWAGGSLSDRAGPLRTAQLVSSSRLGYGARTEWGLFETAGQVPPQDLNATYRVDYFSKRGLALGLDARYDGGFITQTTKDPWNFAGDLSTYWVNDHGVDDLGGERADVDPGRSLRGRLLWQHQHFLPDDWQVQTRLSYVSDPTFLEEWYQDEFRRNQPHDLELYVKRQRDTEALTFLAEHNPNPFVTNADDVQEQFQIDRLPELGYHRIGQSVGRDTLTFFSDNSVGGLEMEPSHATLAQQGYRAGLNPGLPAVGQTGLAPDYTGRGDFRQELDYPFSAGQVRVVPYLIGRYITYSDSPTGDAQNRLYGATGLRLNTTFWAVDDTAESSLLDVHRLRHIVQPELNLYSSAQTLDRDRVFSYDQPVDNINDVSAVQVALHQRWQTQRGGPGQWRSVDLFTLNVEGNYFANQPTDAQQEPTAFRGVFFPTLPEASIPRQSINADAAWRLSDTTAVLADAQYNWAARHLATAAVGLAAWRDPRLSYYLGLRYIDSGPMTDRSQEINSSIGSVAIHYELTSKYSLLLSQSFDFSQRTQVASNIAIIRHFDRFFAVVRVYYNASTDESGVTFNLVPEGLGDGMFDSPFAQR